MTPKKPILISTAILILLFCIILWLVDYSSFGIPEYIGNTKYQTYTVVMFSIMALVLIIFQKALIKQYPSIKLGKLILWSILINMFSQDINQILGEPGFYGLKTMIS